MMNLSPNQPHPGQQETSMKRDPVIRLIALLALIQVLAIVRTVVPFSPEKSKFYAAPPDMIEIQESRGGKIEPLKRADTTIYVRGDLLHKEQVNWAGANIIILGLAALYRWRKLKKAE
jgi:hypothetical protein